MRKIALRTIISFLMALALSSGLASINVINRTRSETLVMEQLAVSKGMDIYKVVSGLLSKAQILSTFIRQSDGDVGDFDRIAAVIVDDPAILNILAAPGGVVTNVYPLEGNELVVGLDFFSEGAGNKEAVLARELGELVLGGPFELVQGGHALVGRLPVYLDTPDGEEEFWGIVSVTLRYPEALEGAGLDELAIHGLEYEIWRISPDSGEKQVIAGSGDSHAPDTNYAEVSINILNAQWYFTIFPLRAWYEYPETWAQIIFAVCVSLLVAFVTQNNCKLKNLKTGFEDLARTDHLTGVNNRRHFLDEAPSHLDRAARLNCGAYIALMDIDGYKNINDKYGHITGDIVLKRIVSRILEVLRPYDLFARYGGDEFVLLASDLDEADMLSLAERIRESIDKTPIEADGNQISISVSIGVAPLAPAYDFDQTIKLADKALYEAKAKGRNRVEMHVGSPE